MPKPPAKPKPPAADSRPAPTERERLAIAAAYDRYRKRKLNVRLQAKQEGKALSIEAAHNDEQGSWVMVMQAMGSASSEFSEAMLMQLSRLARHKDQSLDETRLNAMLAVLDAAQPESEVEAMLLIQMAAAHELAIDLAARARTADTVPTLEALGGLSVRYMRAFALQAEALGKLRRGGEQRVKVEHVHVHPGGQAIVGDVHAGGGGDGFSKDQPHAKPGAR
ncbi:MAG: hypothetical protein ACMVO5_06090 [Polymorphobacter sp.]|uniref:hypothetical protein n=1 Tax=Polymorphobacter sp. TaxID=1909290 RepID=UPI003A87BAAA